MSNPVRPGPQILRRWRWLAVAAAVVAISPLTQPSTANVVDAVLEWNEIALSSTMRAGQGALPQVRTLAIVQVSINDAVNGITGRYPAYLPGGAAPAGASADAAAIAAARTYSLESRSLTESNPGIGFGESAAAAVLAARASDGAGAAQFPYTAPGAGTPGVFVHASPAQVPGWGTVTPWIISSGSQFRPDAPPALTSWQYARDYYEVKELGSLTSTRRTARQTEIGRFWLASPSAIWNHVARQVIQARGLDLSDTARTLALMYLAAGDASIVCWDAKYTYNFWRPQAAIRSGHLDGNPWTIGDPNWQPLFPTPPHPEYISGHATNSSAMATVLRSLFGDYPGVPIVAISPANPGFPRRWQTFTEGVDEVIDARVYSGIHYRTSDETGARVGREVARFVLDNALR